MIQAYLDNIKEVAAEVAVKYTNGRQNAVFNGTMDVRKLTDESMRVIYLWGVINYTYLVGEIPYLGDTAVTDAYILKTSQKLWHYNGVFSSIDLTDYTTIVPDDGEGGACVGGVSETTDHYRSGSLSVSVGANAVTFIKNGVASPLASSDYTVEVWVLTESGYKQNNVVVTTQTAGGFVASDVLEVGTLYYIATLNT